MRIHYKNLKLTEDMPFEEMIVKIEEIEKYRHERLDKIFRDYRERKGK